MRNQSNLLQKMSVSPQHKLKEKLEDMLQKLISKKHIHHAIIALESDDRSFRWIGTTGDARPNGEPLTEGTPFFIASVTKMYIAAAILKLYEQAKIDLDKPMQEYLPQSLIGGLHTLDGTDYTGLITIRHLLSHATGLPDWLDDRPKGGKGMLERIDQEEDRLIGIEGAIAFVRENLVPHFLPQNLNDSRIKVRYSDTNFQLLIAILENITKKPVHQIFDELIYQSLGLRNTHHPGQKPESLPEAAMCWIGATPLSKPLLMESFRDLISTADDLFIFMRGIVSGILFQFPETALLMQQRWNRFGFPRDMAALRQPGWPIEYGMGMMRFKMPRIYTPFKPVPAVVGHTGASGSWLFYCQELDLYLCGTVDQLTAAPVPYRLIPKLIRYLQEEL
jgi:D-alanyl-D-alanine carboxypeptidase